MCENIVLVGAGGHAKALIDVIEQENRFRILGLIDNAKRGDVLGYKVLGRDDDLKAIFMECKNAIVAVGQIKSAQTRILLFNKLKEIGFNLPVIVSPLAYVSKHASIGQGTAIMHYACINAGAKVGANCIINTKALIEHDAVVGDNCHISTASVINGDVIVGDNTFFGSNATSKNGVIIEPSSLIPMASIVKSIGGGVALKSRIYTFEFFKLIFFVIEFFKTYTYLIQFEFFKTEFFGLNFLDLNSKKFKTFAFKNAEFFKQF